LYTKPCDQYYRLDTLITFQIDDLYAGKEFVLKVKVMVTLVLNCSRHILNFAVTIGNRTRYCLKFGISEITDEDLQMLYISQCHTVRKD